MINVIIIERNLDDSCWGNLLGGEKGSLGKKEGGVCSHVGKLVRREGS